MPTLILKPALFKSVADSVYRDILTRSSKYYYFLGSTLSWVNESLPPSPKDSIEYERETRRNIIFFKEIKSTDVAYVIDRINWTSGTVYDMYDDLYTDQIIGINLISGGTNYSLTPNVTISGGNGVGGNVTASVSGGQIVSLTLLDGGYGYNVAPNVIITDTYGTGANAVAVLNYADSGAANLQTAQFYVMTADFNVYKCIDNNGGLTSTVNPTETVVEPFRTSDGYKWKYMYTVPVSLRNKFVSTTQIPVITSLKSQYYSDGEIKNIVVDTSGSGYTYAFATIQGDGYLNQDPRFIVRANVTSIGGGYSSANVVIDPPFSNPTNWSSIEQVTQGTYYSFLNNIYIVTQSGFTANGAGPVHTVGSEINGNCVFKYAGTTATGNANITATGNIDKIILDGIIKSINVTNGGTGYLYAPIISISGTGSNGAAYAVVSNNAISKIIVTNVGKGYTQTPSVTIGVGWAANTTYTVGNQVANASKLYTVSHVINDYQSNTTAPTHTSGNVLLGNVFFTFSGSQANASAELKFGSGYSTSPNVTINGDGSGATASILTEKSEALISPIIENGKIVGATVEDGGIGYTYAEINVAGDGTGAELRADLNFGSLNTFQADSELLAKRGAIYAIKVVSGGYDYSNANITISGDGTGAIATASLLNGRLANVTIVSPGTGYTRANVIISGTGFGAVARAILPPFKGHGRDAPGELYSRSLAFYSTIADDKNQGFNIDSDYRQYGIIKDIEKYSSLENYPLSTGSACWLVSGVINTAIFVDDLILTRISDSAKFVIVSRTTQGALLQSITGQSPTVGDILQAPTSQSFTVTRVTDPEVNKYSGELLYIDNKKAFIPSNEQAVSIKTVIKY